MHARKSKLKLKLWINSNHENRWPCSEEPRYLFAISVLQKRVQNIDLLQFALLVKLLVGIEGG